MAATTAAAPPKMIETEKARSDVVVELGPIAPAEAPSALSSSPSLIKVAAVNSEPLSTPIAIAPATSVVAGSTSTPNAMAKAVALTAPARASVAPPTKKMMIVDHPVAQHALTSLRNKQTPPHQFRFISHSLLVLLLAESTRNLPVGSETVPTFSDEVVGQVLAKSIVLLAVSRHGLGLANRMMDFFPTLLVGAISSDSTQKGRRPEPRLHLANAPALSDTRVILFDPVVSTGASSDAAVQLVRRAGATDISLISFVISSSGLTRIQGASPNLSVWTAAIDTKWDDRRGPMPGIGTFAERMHG